MESIEVLKKQMTRDEVACLVDLIKENKNIISKETNSIQNRIKEESWDQVTVAYNAKCGSILKSKQQLKLKWDNLKKAARKRLQLIKLNNSKTGGGTAINIPVDEILDKVAELLGSTGSGFEVPFGGDGVLSSIDIEYQHNTELANLEQSYNDELNPGPSEVKKQKSNKTQINGVPILRKPYKSVKRDKENDARIQKNLAIAKYFDKKTEKLELEIQRIKKEMESSEKC